MPPTLSQIDTNLDNLSGEVRDIKTSLFGLGDAPGRLGSIEAALVSMEKRMRKLEDSKLVAIGWMMGAVAVGTVLAQIALKLIGG
jgi:hypothetical protein